MEPVALSALALVAVIGIVAIILAVLNRHSMRWRFGVFYERDDLTARSLEEHHDDCGGTDTGEDSDGEV